MGAGGGGHDAAIARGRGRDVVRLSGPTVGPRQLGVQIPQETGQKEVEPTRDEEKG